MYRLRLVMLVTTLALLAPECRAQERDTLSAVGREALTAELAAHITCAEPIETRDTAFRAFPEVRFRVGSCIAEHEATYSVVLGMDSQVLYLLDAPSSFNLLLARHRPNGLSVRNVLSFALVALVLRGDVSASARRLSATDNVPDSLASAMRRRGLQLPSTTVTRFTDGAYEVAFPVIDRNSIISFRCTVELATGTTTATQVWRVVAWE